MPWTQHTKLSTSEKSPCREATLHKVKQEMPEDSSGIRMLCPTKWTIEADALQSTVTNYEFLQYIAVDRVTGFCQGNRNEMLHSGCSIVYEHIWFLFWHNPLACQQSTLKSIHSDENLICFGKESQGKED